MKNLNGVKSWVTGFDKATTEVDDLDVLYDFAKESLGGSTDETITTAETQELEESYSKAIDLTPLDHGAPRGILIRTDLPPLHR